MNRRLPAPQAQAFVVCRKIVEQQDPPEVSIVGPKCHVPVHLFPAEVELSVYVHITGGHGSYPLELLLRDSAGDPVWRWNPPDLLEHPDPLEPHQLLFHDVKLCVPQAGRFELVLLAGDEEIGRQPLLLGTREMLEG
jgi:hypothetical protein